MNIKFRSLKWAWSLICCQLYCQLNLADKGMKSLPWSVPFLFWRRVSNCRQLVHFSHLQNAGNLIKPNIKLDIYWSNLQNVAKLLIYLIFSRFVLIHCEANFENFQTVGNLQLSWKHFMNSDIFLLKMLLEAFCKFWLFFIENFKIGCIKGVIWCGLW